MYRAHLFMKQKKLVLFDIDGTLLWGYNPLLRSRFAHAIEKVHGKKVDTDWTRFEGGGDNYIIKTLLRDIGISEEEINSLMLPVHEAVYDFFVANAPPDYASSILPGAKDILDTLKNRVYLGLLTGNYEKTAMHKLKLIGLDQYFSFGVFGHEADHRDDLARLVQKKAKTHFGIHFKNENIFIIGDTPRDVSCAKAIQAKSIAVPTGKYTMEQLATHHPDVLVENLLDPTVVKYIMQ
jgi:phosphoglycolate phosphatase